MIQAACQCEYPEGAKELFCDRHRCPKFRRLVELCNLGARGEAIGVPYWTAWEEGRGPKQPGAPTGTGRQDTPAERLEKTFRSYVLSRQQPGMDFDQALGWLACRSWDAIQKSMALCLKCEHFQIDRCVRLGSSCQARTEWIGYVLRRPCRQFKRAPLHTPLIATVITTAPRNGPPLLARCIQSVTDAGLDAPWICAEPGSNLPANVQGMAHLIRQPKRLGCWQNWLQSLQDALERAPGAEAILTLQDDAELCGGISGFLGASLWPSPRCGMLLLYLSSLYSGQPAGFARLPDSKAEWLVGACAMLFPRHVAYQIVARGRVHGWKGHPHKTVKEPAKKRGVDCFAGRTVVRLGYEVWSINPSLANHDAKHSTVGHGGSQKNRVPHKWIGRRGDAAKIIRLPRSRYALPSGSRITPTSPGGNELAVVIPMAGDCADLMDACLRHLAQLAKTPLRVIVIDNGTPAGVGEAVDRAAKAAGLLAYRRLRNHDNLGFTRACNQGIELADSRDVLLLNSDCRVGPNCIPLLLQGLARHDKVAAVGPLTFDDGAQSLKHTKRLRQSRLPKLPPRPVDQDKLVGLLPSTSVSRELQLAFFCTALRRTAIDAIGLLDESPGLESGLGVDDLWCHRARELGWEVLVHHGAYACHDHHATFKQLGLDRRGLQRRAIATLKRKK